MRREIWHYILGLVTGIVMSSAFLNHIVIRERSRADMYLIDNQFLYSLAFPDAGYNRDRREDIKKTFNRTVEKKEAAWMKRVTSPGS